MLIFSKNVAKTLGMMELGLVVGTIDQANLAIADLVFKLHRLFIYDDYSIVGCVGYDE